MLSLVLLYAIHDSDRFPWVQAFASSCRLVKWAKESAGKRLGTSGTKIGDAHLQWAFAEAATLCLRNHAPGPTYRARLEKKPAQGKALTILAHTWARDVSDMLKRHTACDLESFVRTARNRAGEPGASLAPYEMSRQSARAQPCSAASVNAQVCLGRLSRSPGLGLDARSGSSRDDDRRPRLLGAASPPNLALTGERDPFSQACA